MATVTSNDSGMLRRFIRAIEPWYDWGKVDFFRLDAKERDFSDESEGEGRFFALQWFGLHLQIEVGIVPPKVSDEEIRQRKAQIAAAAARREQSA